MAVYLVSMAPGLTWANDGADGGDLIAAAASGGVAHPTGYPLYLILARLFQFIPLGSLAFRTNLMSAVATVLACELVYGVVTRYLSTAFPQQYWLAGLAAGFAFGLSPLIWSQAVITEVYALHSLFVALLLFLSLNVVPANSFQKRADCLFGLVFGLAMGNHITIVLIFPIIFASATNHKPGPHQEKSWSKNWQVDGCSLLRKLGWILVGLSVYLTLPLRALSHPPVNWGNPVTLDGFIWLVSGRLYKGLLLSLSISSILARTETVVTLLLEQFGIIGITFGLLGLIVFFRPTRLNYYMLWIVVASCIFAVGYAALDAYLYLIPAFLCFSIWIGVGLAKVMEVSSKRLKIIGIVISLILFSSLMVQTWKTWPSVDASHDQRAESFGRSVISIAPAQAIVFAKGDQALFALWYFEFALRSRPDLVIISNDLLQFGWYLQTLRSTYPGMNLPGSIPFVQTVVEANPGRPVCYIQYIQVAEINCLPAAGPHLP